MSQVFDNKSIVTTASVQGCHTLMFNISDVKQAQGFKDFCEKHFKYSIKLNWSDCDKNKKTHKDFGGSVQSN